MSLDVYLTIPPCACCGASERTVYDGNITHNLTTMAEEAQLYGPVWRPEENGITHAKDLTPLLEKGIAELESNPAYYQRFNAGNNWGTYYGFLRFLREYLAACKQWPAALVYASR